MPAHDQRHQERQNKNKTNETAEFMLEKLTARERKLAYGVIGLVPAVLVFVGVYWFIGEYNAYTSRENSLLIQIGDEELRMEAAKKADRRRAYYDSISLPADVEDASNNYQSWLKGLVRDELKMQFKSLTPSDASDLKHKTELIGQRRTYLLRADGTLAQLTDLLARFYSSDLLHRIDSIKITAQNETSGSNKKIRTGLLGIAAKIEVLALTTAVDNADFLERFNAQRAAESKLAETNLAYRAMVLRRDIFGPPNNTPTLAASPKSSYLSESDAEFSLTAKDADDEDLMNFEIIESSVEGFKLEQSEPGSRTASFTVPGQKAGRYKFKVQVTDDGFPAKESSVEEFYVTFKDAVVEKKDPPPIPDPPYINAKETQITGIVLEKSGDWRVWIKVRTTGDKYKLKVGESFELDEQKWVVEEIKPEQAVLRVENKLLTFKPTDRFVNPRTEVILEVPATNTLNELPEKGAKVEIDSDAAPKPRTSI